jgi:pullulanase
MVRMAMVLLLTSPGIPFLHAGQEFLRSKNGVDNSYDLPDEVNMVKWSQKETHRDIHAYVRGLISLRRAHGALRMRSAAEREASLFFLDEDLELAVPDRAIAFLIKRGDREDGYEELLVAVNAHAAPQTFQLPSKNWDVLADQVRAGPHAQRRHAGATLTIPQRSAWILAR